MKLLLSLFVSSLLIVSVYGHAKLVSPVAFNPNPSKAAPCGDGNILPGPAANWPPGSTQTLAWTVVAGDGTGAIRAFVDPKGGTGLFPTSVPTAGTVPTGLTEIILSGTTPSTTIPYTFTLTVPNVVCNGPSGFCTVVVFSTSSWWACTTVNISSAIPITNNTNIGPPAPTCQNATDLPFCTRINSKQVSIPFGQSLLDLDNAAKQAYIFNLGNPKVFTRPSTAGCPSAYKFLVCATIFRRCGGGLIADCDYYIGAHPYGCFCKNTCFQARDLCGLNTTHTGLLNCDTSQIADYDITTSACSSLTFNAATDAANPDDTGLSAGGGNTLVIAMSSLLIAVILALFS